LQPFQPTAAPSAGTLAGWMANPNPPAPHATVASGPAALSAPPNSGFYLAVTLDCYIRWLGKLYRRFPRYIEYDMHTSYMPWSFCIYHCHLP